MDPVGTPVGPRQEPPSTPSAPVTVNSRQPRQPPSTPSTPVNPRQPRQPRQPRRTPSQPVNPVAPRRNPSQPVTTRHPPGSATRAGTHRSQGGEGRASPRYPTDTSPNYHKGGLTRGQDNSGRTDGPGQLVLEKCSKMRQNQQKQYILDHLDLPNFEKILKITI